MNILLQQLSDEINARGYSKKTLSAYLAANDHLICYFVILTNLLQRYLMNVLHREFVIKVIWPKKQYKIPELMSRAEVQTIIQHCTPEKYRVMLSILYGCGLRISELLNLKVQDIGRAPHV